MTLKMFEELFLYVGIGSLVLYLLFMMVDLGRQSNAGRYGLGVLFLIMGLGAGSFFIKSVIEFVVPGLI